MSEAHTTKSPLPFLEAYNPTAVGYALGFGDHNRLVPEARCMEDRPELYNYVLPRPHDLRNGEAVVAASNQAMARRSGLWTLDGRPIDPMVDRLPMREPENGGPVDAMIASGQHNGLSVPGGRWGWSAAFALGQEMTRPGSFTEKGMPVTSLSKLVDMAAPGRDHEDCKARGAAAAIIGFIADKPEIWEGTAIETAPWADQSRFGKLVDAARSLRRAGAVPEDLPPPVRPRGLLRRTDDSTQVVTHSARYVAAINNTLGHHVILNTRKAWDAGHPLYGLNVGFYPEIADTMSSRLSPLLGHAATENIVTAALGYGGATINNLPKRPDGLPPQVLYVDGATVHQPGA